ncbi:nucleotide-binding protein [Caballeronia grimmiae]|uniref:nucleotide-binding protein n=1 Tax=Caballeronia grimmiae TaxID=1071679 RepID=UPI0038BD322B
MTVIAVVSTAGGAGRTTICSALAVLLARRARQVFAIELDAQNNPARAEMRDGADAASLLLARPARSADTPSCSPGDAA